MARIKVQLPSGQTGYIQQEDYDPQTFTAVPDANQPSEGTTGSSGGIEQPQNIRKLLGISLLGKAKNVSDVATIMEKFIDPAPSEADKKRKEKADELENDLQNSYYNIGKARKEIGDSGTGLGYADLFNIRNKLGLFGKEGNETNTALANLNELLFQVAGKAFTGSERSLLEGKVLGIGKDKSANEAALKDREATILRKMKELGITPIPYAPSPQNDGFIPD